MHISFQFVAKGLINNNSTFVWVIALCQACDKPLPEQILEKMSDDIWYH